MTADWWPQARTGDLVGYLTDDEHERLLAATEAAAVAPGDLVLRRGSPSRSLILVEEGELEVFDPSLGASAVLATVGAGGVVGEVGFVDGRPRTQDVRARTACRLRRLTRERLLALKSDQALFAKLTIGLAELLAMRFRYAVQELEPVREFVAGLQEPLDTDAGPAASDFDEIDEPLPEDAVAVLRKVARRSRKDLAGL
jgi:CRP-like cAMP-binding protein